MYPRQKFTHCLLLLAAWLLTRAFFIFRLMREGQLRRFVKSFLCREAYAHYVIPMNASTFAAGWSQCLGEY